MLVSCLQAKIDCYICLEDWDVFTNHKSISLGEFPEIVTHSRNHIIKGIPGALTTALVIALSLESDWPALRDAAGRIFPISLYGYVVPE